MKVHLRLKAPTPFWLDRHKEYIAVRSPHYPEDDPTSVPRSEAFMKAVEVISKLPEYRGSDFEVRPPFVWFKFFAADIDSKLERKIKEAFREIAG